MSLSPEDLALVDTIDQHPELARLIARAPASLDAAGAARATARRLVGASVDEPGPLASLLAVIAARELDLLETQCRMQPARAIVATAALMEALLERYLAETEEPGDERDQEAKAAVDQVRESLAALVGRKLPDGFPLPALAAEHGHRDPIHTAAVLAENLAVDHAVDAAHAALTQYRDTLSVLEALLPGFGWDFGMGELTRTLLHQLHRLAALLDRLSVLRRIVDELGRMEGSARKARVAEYGGRDSVIGVRVGGEFADVLPCELALLGQAQTEDLFYQRYIEHRLLCLELQGASTSSESAPDRRGPIVACVDTSGSMQGAPEAVAKALILTVIRQARPERRPVRIILFGGPGELSEIDICHQRAGLHDLLAFLALGFHAGTDFDGPLLHALGLLDNEVYDRADILVITDGLCRASRTIVDRVQQVKSVRDCRIVSVVVGGDARSVQVFSDQVWEVDPNAPTEGRLDLRRWVAA
jgi:hypothetical protein